MNIDYDRLRLDGIYKQDDQGSLMLRVKAPAGVLSSEQVAKVCDISEKYSNGMLHVTTRCSLEFHWLKYRDLPEIWRAMASVGLTSRGACGGAVRGVSCGTSFAPGFASVQLMAARIQRHFAGNPRFEGLPKKFKISVEGSLEGGRHLMQDAALVLQGGDSDSPAWDLWVAGGLGREPMEGFLYERSLSEHQVLPLLEALVQVHREQTPKGKRLKHVVQSIGQQSLRDLVEEKRRIQPVYELVEGFPRQFTPGSGAPPVEAVVFAGEIKAPTLRQLGSVASRHGGGYLVLTAEQNVALFPESQEAEAPIRAELAALGFDGDSPEQQILMRICPGSHQCRMGLAPTRDLARAMLPALSDGAKKLSFALSGCPNSCAQAQLAQVGIFACKSVKQEDGSRKPLYNLLRRQGEGFGTVVAEALDEQALLAEIGKIS